MTAEWGAASVWSQSELAIFRQKEDFRNRNIIDVTTDTIGLNVQILGLLPVIF